MIYVDQNYKLMGGHKVKTSSRNPYNGPGGPPRIIDGTGTGIIILDTERSSGSMRTQIRNTTRMNKKKFEKLSKPKERNH